MLAFIQPAKHPNSADEDHKGVIPMGKENVKFIGRIILSLLIGFLVVYPLFLYGRHFLIR